MITIIEFCRSAKIYNCKSCIVNSPVCVSYYLILLWRVFMKESFKIVKNHTHTKILIIDKMTIIFVNRTCIYLLNQALPTFLSHHHSIQNSDIKNYLAPVFRWCKNYGVKQKRPIAYISDDTGALPYQYLRS